MAKWVKYVKHATWCKVIHFWKGGEWLITSSAQFEAEMTHKTSYQGQWQVPGWILFPHRALHRPGKCNYLWTKEDSTSFSLFNVHQVTTGDSGIYYCTASGPDGVSKTASVQIQVVTRGWIQWRMNARTSLIVIGGDWTSKRRYDSNLGSGWWWWSLLWSYRWCSPLRSFQWSAIGWRPVKAGRLRSVDAGRRGFKSLKVSKKFLKTYSSAKKCA